eukprot:TRINITY_DN46291_c0_g1_i1.p1 TRINITY_DN46291_c0_g1~~TRINITY_DN46291_c0_g1_i1.p1  ORF type:complete len:490 (-),score=107.05 TRINITY_DN46291_c0_g1_i1:196-1665(-)
MDPEPNIQSGAAGTLVTDGNRNLRVAAQTRWTILLLTCGGLLGKFYAFDIPAVLRTELKAEVMPNVSLLTGSDLEAVDEEFKYYYNLMYSVYAIPNIVLPLLLGAAVDTYGCHTLIVSLGALVVIGAVLVSVGVARASWMLLLFGRVIFGIGGESLQIAQNCMLFRWFQGKEVSLALGMLISFSRVGSLLNGWASPEIASRFGVHTAVWAGALFCLASFFCNALSIWVDRTQRRIAGVSDEESSGGLNLSAILKLPRTFWLLAVLCVVLYCGVMPFYSIGATVFEEDVFARLPVEEARNQADKAMPFLFLVPAIGSPIFGGLVDTVGMRSQFLLFSSLLLTACYLMIFVASPTAFMLALGMVYMIFSGAIWPALALAVPQAMVGVAYGIALCFVNAGLALAPLLVSYLELHETYPYRYREGQHLDVVLLFLAFGFTGVLLSLGLYVTNRLHGGILDLPAHKAEFIKRCNESAPLPVGKCGSYATCEEAS